MALFIFYSVMSAAAIHALPNTFGLYQRKPMTVGIRAAPRIAIGFMMVLVLKVR